MKTIFKLLTDVLCIVLFNFCIHICVVIVLFCYMCMYYVFVAFCGPNIIDRVCYDHDGCNCWYRSPVRRGWYRLSVGYFPYSINRVVSYSSMSPPSRVLVYCAWYYISPVHTFYVPSVDPLFHYKPQQCNVGNSRSSCEENEKGMYLMCFMFI